MGGIRPKYEFAKEWLTPELETIILFAVNSTMSYAQIDRMLKQTIEEMGVDIIEGH